MELFIKKNVTKVLHFGTAREKTREKTRKK